MIRVALFSTVVVVVVAGVMSAFFPTGSAASLQDLRRCVKQQGTIDEACAERGVQSLLSIYPATYIMSEMQGSFTAPECHVIGHVVGREIFRKTNSVETAIAECSSACTSTCIHGIVGAAFAEVPDVRLSLQELQHLDLGTLRSEGEKLCFNREACHAVGHILFQLFGELDPALSECKTLSNGKEPWSCYRGVFMENNTVQSTLNVYDTSYPNYRNPDDLLSPCTSVGVDYQHACFHFLALNQERTFYEKGISDPQEKRQMRIDACNTIEMQSLKDACFEGVSFSLYFLEEWKLDDVTRLCESLERGTERAACAFGFSYHLATFGKMDEMRTFCGGYRDEDVQVACYQAALDATHNAYTFDARTFCGSANARCTIVLDAYLKNPSQMVFMWK